jgi:hypothetical protein
VGCGVYGRVKERCWWLKGEGVVEGRKERSARKGDYERWLSQNEVKV